MNLLFVDCETTGLDPLVHRPWEVCAVAATLDGTVLRCAEPFLVQLYLTGAEMRAAESAALEIGRFRERRRKVLSNRAKAAMDLADYVRTHSPDELPRLVGIVPSFDVRMLEWLIPAHRQPWHHRIVCARTLAIGQISADPLLTAASVLGSTTTDVLAAYNLEEDPATAHTAAGDVAMTIRLFAAVLGLTVEGAGVSPDIAEARGASAAQRDRINT